MSALFWPGDHRAGSLMSDSALLRAMVAVEQAWLEALVEHRLADPGATGSLADLVSDSDLGELATRAEHAGNPVLALVDLLRARARTPATVMWLHRGLTSQDVLDTALVLCARDALASVRADVDRQVAAVLELAVRFRDAPMVARTLTQHAVPYTFGLKAALWLQGVLDAAEDLDRIAAALPSQLGGAAGTMAAAVELAASAGAIDPVGSALAVAASTSARLGLVARTPWHTTRAPITRLGDALCGAIDAWGRIANDVLLLARPEIAELAEPGEAGRGASSTMPQKTNPVLSVLIRRAALTAPTLAAQLHLTAAEAVDERPDGAWHAEWLPLHLLGRQAVIAAAQATELLTGLRVEPERMRATLTAAQPGIDADRTSLAQLRAPDPDRATDAYVGAAGVVVDAICERARLRIASHG